MAAVIWTGVVEGQTYRVVDKGAGNAPRLTVEIQGIADAMGTKGWGRFDPIPTTVFEGMLIAAGVVT